MKTLVSWLWDKSYLIAMTIFLTVGLPLSAAETFPYGGTLQPNVEYSFDGVELSATFIPSITGEISYNCVGIMSAYSDSSHTERIEQVSSSYIDGFQVNTIKVTKNIPVYFYAEAIDVMFFANPGELFKVTENEPIKFLNCSIPEGEVLSLTSGYSDLIVYFNQGVISAGATIAVSGTDIEVPVTMSTDFTPSLSVNYATPLMSLVNSDKIKGGEELIVSISGIRNSAGSEYNNGEDLVIRYKAPAKPVTILSKRLPDPFLSYWKEGDSDALVTVEYSGDISKASYLLKYGDFESEVPDGYIEEGESDDPSSPAKITIDGNKVTVDLSGKQRRPQDMVPSGADYGVILVRVAAFDSVGEPVAGDGQGMVGSFEQEVSYLYVSPAQFNTTFTPESGQSLKNRESLYLHLYDYEKVQFSGVKFEIENGPSIIVPKSEITETGGPDFDWTLTIPVPEAVRTTNLKVTVTFEDMDFLDRDDHSEEFSAVYFGSSAGLNTDFYVLPAEGYVDELLVFEIGCENFITGLSENVELQLTLSSVEDREILHTFSMEDCKILSTPKAGIEIPDGISENDSRYYSTVATFTLPSPIADEGGYLLVIPEGFFTFSQTGSEAVSLNSVRTVAYEIPGKQPVISYTATPEPGTVRELSEVSIYFPEGPGFGMGEPQLIINSGLPITLQADPEYPADFEDISMTLKITMPTTYTSQGTYEIILPEGYLLDANGDPVGEYKLTYYIGTTGIESVTVNGGTLEVYTLDGRHMTVKDEDLKVLDRGIYIVNGQRFLLK